MPVFALYNFDDSGLQAQDSALGNGPQNGAYFDGATAVGGQAVLDGVNDFVKMFSDPAFQLDRGTLEIQFTLSDIPQTATQTVLSRDSTGANVGSYRIDILTDGAVVISHETATDTTTFGTAPGFANPGDEISLDYSWDLGGAGGQMNLTNITSGDTFSEPVPADLTMDMAGLSQPWIVGAGQTQSDPSLINNINQHFEGNVEFFSLSDTVDNVPTAPTRDGIVSGTPGADLINTAYVGDPDGDRVDNVDAILPGDAPNDDRIVAGGGDDTIFAGLGDDSVEAGDGDDIVTGGAGNDTVFGGEGDDTIDGNGGDDVLFGGNGSDSVDGNAGDDLIDTRGGGPLPLPDLGYPGLYPADADPFDDLDTVEGGAGNDTIFTGDDADLIYGGRGNDFIDGGIDNDTIFGGQNNDTIIGGEGSDVIDGGQGDDLIFGGLGPEFPDSINIPDDAGDLVRNNGADLIRGGMGQDTIYGLDDDDTIDGGQGDDFIDAGVDDDVVTGGSGNDTIIGGQGDDTLSGGNDRDVFIGGNAGDVVDGNEGGDDFDTLDLTGAGPLRVIYDPTNAENGTVNFLNSGGDVTGTMSFVNIENVIPCFTPGTLIATPRGEVQVEQLRVGDRVITRDNGLQEIRWIGTRALSRADLNAAPHLKPVLVRQGSLGNGLPERDMLVSPNHRLLVANDRTALYFDEHEVLVAAKHLIAGQGVHTIESMGTTYVHFMCDRHEVVLSNGAWTESFQPGDLTLKGMGNAQRCEIFDLFPELKTDAGLSDYAAARRTLKRHEAMLLAS
jgi:Ca2+-binding RTX toxin-like protein